MFISFTDKKTFKEKRKEYRSQWKSSDERKFENNPETTNTTTSEDHVPSSASSTSSYKSKKYGNLFNQNSLYSKHIGLKRGKKSHFDRAMLSLPQSSVP